MTKEELIDKALEAIKADVQDQDLTAIAELLEYCPTENLLAYLCIPA